jgi:hypothetical protein
MKTGDPKQAAILGIVAVGAIGFLGKTLFGSFAGGGNVKPVAVAVREGKPEDRTAERADAGNNQDQKPSNSTSESVTKRKDKEGTESNSSSLSLSRDAFAVPTNAKRDPVSSDPVSDAKRVAEAAAERAKTSSTATDQPDPRLSSRGFPPGGFPGFRNRGSELPPADPNNPPSFNSNESSDLNRTKDKKITKPEKALEVRYEGFVNAGNPVAVIRVGEQTFNVELNDALLDGIRVVQISDEKVVLMVRGKSRTAWLGRTVNL